MAWIADARFPCVQLNLEPAITRGSLELMREPTAKAIIGVDQFPPRVRTYCVPSVVRHWFAFGDANSPHVQVK